MSEATTEGWNGGDTGTDPAYDAETVRPGSTHSQAQGDAPVGDQPAETSPSTPSRPEPHPTDAPARPAPQPAARVAAAHDGDDNGYPGHQRDVAATNARTHGGNYESSLASTAWRRAEGVAAFVRSRRSSTPPRIPGPLEPAVPASSATSAPVSAWSASASPASVPAAKAAAADVSTRTRASTPGAQTPEDDPDPDATLKGGVLLIPLGDGDGDGDQVHDDHINGDHVDSDRESAGRASTDGETRAKVETGDKIETRAEVKTDDPAPADAALASIGTVANSNDIAGAGAGVESVGPTAWYAGPNDATFRHTAGDLPTKPDTRGPVDGPNAPDTADPTASSAPSPAATGGEHGAGIDFGATINQWPVVISRLPRDDSVEIERSSWPATNAAQGAGTGARTGADIPAQPDPEDTGYRTARLLIPIEEADQPHNRGPLGWLATMRSGAFAHSPVGRTTIALVGVVLVLVIGGAMLLTVGPADDHPVSPTAGALRQVSTTTPSATPVIPAAPVPSGPGNVVASATSVTHVGPALPATPRRPTAAPQPQPTTTPSTPSATFAPAPTTVPPSTRPACYDQFPPILASWLDQLGRC